ncbi:hypothetical protein [Flavobacterium luminosum]|uniref:Uncharacterized protein n=1 Tax=Flavobacterium luminosum TaxID=2949086 RepID=A0ABT0TMG3_9FLAO|nr:hypothetical protein [Flavobacterium sp. HXWNR70]MCL9808683.1 hypothetical protein [Flavobacterium sp. HXWNR70]
MSNYSLLSEYSYTKINNSQFQITFKIPDNCFYNLVCVSGKYTIEIKLNPGETTPSTVFIEETEIVNMISDSLNFKFEQYESAKTIIKKPSGILTD